MVRNTRELRFKRNVPVDTETPEETDLVIALEKQKNRGAIQMLMQLADANPELQQHLINSLTAQGLNIPQGDRDDGDDE